MQVWIHKPSQEKHVYKFGHCQRFLIKVELKKIMTSFVRKKLDQQIKVKKILGQKKF